MAKERMSKKEKEKAFTVFLVMKALEEMGIVPARQNGEKAITTVRRSHGVVGKLDRKFWGEEDKLWGAFWRATVALAEHNEIVVEEILRHALTDVPAEVPDRVKEGK